MASSFPMPMMDPSTVPYWPITMTAVPNGMSHMTPMTASHGTYQAAYHHQAGACPVPVPNYLPTTNQIHSSSTQMTGQQMWVNDSMMSQQQGVAGACATGRHAKGSYRNGIGGSNSPVSDGSCVVDSLSGMHCSSPPLVAPVARRLTAQGNGGSNNSSFVQPNNAVNSGLCMSIPVEAMLFHCL